MSKTLAQKLLEVQIEVGSLGKNAINPFFKSKYIEINGVLEAVLPALQSRGILLQQPTTNVGGLPALQTRFVDTITGEVMENTSMLIQNNDPQKAGGILTYQRRYDIIAGLGFPQEDDDANLSSGKKTKAAPKKKVTARVDSF